MYNKLTNTALLCIGVIFSVNGKAYSYDVVKVLEKASKLQKSIGYVSDHVEGGHTHFDIVTKDGSKLEICPHPKMGLLHIMQANKLPGLRSVVEINLKNEVKPYKRNPFTSFLHYNSHSSRGLRHLADRGMQAIMDAE